ncbi:hypothetical protein QE152_g27823 [Popillia japonica]|uniref:Uncharacterized protein n=1 Tax=Popillia japonica TaxID=7064 RepID=A0AAW1JL12_POPJA
MGSKDFDEEDDLPLTQWNAKHTSEEDDTNSNLLLSKWFSRNAGDISTTIDDFITVYHVVNTADMPTDMHIVHEITVAEQGEIDAEGDSAQNYDCVAPNCEETVTAIKTVIRLLESVYTTDDKILNASLMIENHLQQRVFELLTRQTYMTDYA